jgi:glycosyltransferase involved in cell wall biosynthesis
MNPNGELTLLHVGSSSIGYGRLGVELHNALDRRGVDVYDHIDKPEWVQAQMSSSTRKVSEGRRHKLTNAVGWVSVPTHADGWWEGQWPFVFTMWEATWLPESFRESLHNFEAVLVPSMQNVELFGQYHPNVRYVPLGVDPEAWQYRERKAPGATFDVLVGGSGGRKGLDVAVRAFAKAFPEGSWGDGPVPRLVLKSPKSNLGLDPLLKAELPFPPMERLSLIHGRLTAEEEIGLYSTAHVYLQPSRGEGFGLQPLQAIAQGCPTILTDAHGHEAFSHLGWGVGSTMTKAGYFIYGDDPSLMWWEPSVDDCVDQLRTIYNDYEGACAIAARASVEALRTFTWDTCCDAFVDALDGQHLVEPSTTGEWFKPDHKRYLVRVRREWNADIAGVHYRLVPGEDYYELSDVKRILFESEVLDPSCLDSLLISDNEMFDNGGLTQDQAEAIPNYTAAHSFCGSCGQQMNGQNTRADLLWALSQARNGVDDETILTDLMSVRDTSRDVG